jgi:hypothetical protein
MSESFTMKSKDGRREVSAYLDAAGGWSSLRGWRMSFTKRTQTRSETRDGWTRTKTEAVKRAKAFITLIAKKKRLA